MVTVDKASVAKYKFQGHNFEILVDADLAIEFRSGKPIDIRNVLAVQKVYTESRKGMEASSTVLNAVFKTSDALEVAKVIIQKGEVPLTTEYKEKLREQKRRQIVSYIHVNAVDPKTHHPHPPQRIESAMSEAKVHIDEFEDVQKQIQEVVKKLRVILPLSFEVKEIAVKIPAEYASKTFGIIQNFGKKIKEEWLNDGSYDAVIEMPAGLEEDFHSKINSICHGNVETKVLKIHSNR